MNTHIQDVVNVFEYEDLLGVILVGHSFGGTLASLVAEKIPDRIARLVNLDGPFPEDGKALKDLIGDYWDFFQKNAIDPADPERIQPIADWTFGVTGADLKWMQSKLTPPSTPNVDDGGHPGEPRRPRHPAHVYSLHRGSFR